MTTTCNLQKDSFERYEDDYISRAYQRCSTDDLDSYRPIGPWLVQMGLTATELDKFLTIMEHGIECEDTPGIARDDMISLHGDVVLVFADLVNAEQVPMS